MGKKLGDLVAQLAMFQLSVHRHFIIENPVSSDLWTFPAYQALLNTENVTAARCDQCMFNLKDPDGKYTLKPTVFLCSSPILAEPLQRRCEGKHEHVSLAGKANGVSRCAFAQMWTEDLCQAIVSGILQLLKQESYVNLDDSQELMSFFPAAVQDRCPGCVSHAARHDARHNRKEGICRFPFDETKLWDCPACQRYLPSTHDLHKLDDSCQWSHARRRASHLREPKPKPVEVPRPVPLDEPNCPPPVSGMIWKAVEDKETLITLRELSKHNGWTQVNATTVAIDTANARSIRSPEPRFDIATYSLRSTYGMFPNLDPTWWQLEDKKPMTSKLSLDIGFLIPLLITMFHKDVTSTKNNTRNGPLQNPDLDVPSHGSSSSSSSRPAAQPQPPQPEQQPAEPIGDEEPVIPIEEIRQREESEEGNMPDPGWSSFDLGRALRALRSGIKTQQATAIRRLHLRWWHASSARMKSLLNAANVPKEAISLVDEITNSCKICRLWQRPSTRSTHASRLSEQFNQCVQFDLLFVENMTIGVLLDEATRWTVARIIPGKEATHILRFITDDWLRLFGSPQVLMSDQEGGLYSEEGAVWMERHSISAKPVPRGAHASMVERHHQTLRLTVQKLLAQARSESLSISAADIVAEAVLAKNAMSNVAGFSPYEAVLGRKPNLLIDLDCPTTSAVDDSSGGLIGISRHATRIRELAVACMVEATAATRMKLANQARTRLSSQQMELEAGSLVDIFRSPSRKDLSGWRGPCKVVAVRGGTIDVMWNNRILICRPQDVRVHVPNAFLANLEAPQLLMLQDYLRQTFQDIRTVAWVYSETGWRLSRAAVENPQLFRAILFTGSQMMQLNRCIGARLGRGFHTLGALSRVMKCILMWWPSDKPGLYQTFIHNGDKPLHLRQMIEVTGSHAHSNDFAWIQFLSVDTHNSRRIRHAFPDTPHLHPDDPNDPPWMPPRNNEPMQVDPPQPNNHNYPPPHQPMDTQSSHNTTMIAPTDDDPHPPHDPHAPVPKYQRPSSPRNGPQKHPVPSTASSSHRPWKQHNSTDKSTSQRPVSTNTFQPTGGSSSSSGHNRASGEHRSNPPMNIPAHVPILPMDQDDDDDDNETAADSDATLQYEHNEVEQDDFLVALYNDGPLLLSYVEFLESEGIELPKAPGDLTPDEIKKHWKEVADAVRKELRSFIDLKVWEIRKKGSTANRMTSKMLLKWKFDPVKKIRVCKARLTVRGFQDKDRHTETFASTASRWGQRIIVMIAVQQQWQLLTADIGAAFLRGLTFQELSSITNQPLRQCSFEFPRRYVEFIRELPGHSDFNPDCDELYMLKPIYGLQDAPRAWRMRLHISLIASKAQQLTTDTCLYVWYVTTVECSGKKMWGALSTHVDDLKITGTVDFTQFILSFLEKEFGALKVQKDKFEHCGLIHEANPDGSIIVHQNHYGERLKPIDLTGVTLDQPTAACSPMQCEAYSSGVGAIAWMAQTRIDVLVHIQSLQRATKSPTIGHLIRLNIVIKWIKRKPLHIKYHRLQTPNLITLVINDAAFRREDSTGLAMRGSLIALAEDRPQLRGTIRLMLVDYYSKRQRNIVRSTFGAETHAAADGAEVGKLVAYTFAELLTPGVSAAQILRMEAEGRLPTPLHIITDCKSLYDSLRMDEVQVPSESSLIMVLLQLKEGLRTGSIRAISWVDTRDMCADGLNKGIIARRALRAVATTGEWELQHDSQTFTEATRNDVTAEVVDSEALSQARQQASLKS